MYRALTLSALGLTEDAIISYCLSVHFNRNLTILSKTNRLEVAKVQFICKLIDFHRMFKSFQLFFASFFFSFFQLIQKFLMNCNLTTKSSSVHDYLNRCHLRTLKHFPKSYNDKCFSSDPLDYDDDCLGNFNSSTEKMKAGIHTKFRHSERENYCFPYKKSLKLLKSTKRFRRKHFNAENGDKLQEIAYLNQLADSVLTNDTVVSPAGVSNMDKRISKLLDQIQYEILKAKRKYDYMVRILYTHIFCFVWINISHFVLRFFSH